MNNKWLLSSSSDPRALAVVDGLGTHFGQGPHYSRRTPGSRTFTGVGQEVVLITEGLDAVWAVVRQRTPHRMGTGCSRGRKGTTDESRYVWRNMLFRNLSPHLSSDLIRSALIATYIEWSRKYGSLPEERLRTEVDPKKIRSTNPGCCYLKAGFHNRRKVRGKIYMDAPCPNNIMFGNCECCPPRK